MIPDEAVEAAAWALRDAFDWGVDGFEEQAKRALEAAAPHIIAAHFREINRKAIAHEIETPLQFKKDAPDA